MDTLYDVLPNGYRVCPYNTNHLILTLRFPYHLMKCSKSSGKNYEVCPFNAQHHIVEPHSLQAHVIKCEERSHAEAERGYMDYTNTCKMQKSSDENLAEQNLNPRQQSDNEGNEVERFDVHPVVAAPQRRAFNEPRSEPAYAVEAKKLLDESDAVLEEERYQYEQSLRLKMVERGILPWGRAKPLYIDPYHDPETMHLRPVPHQYIVNYNRPSHLDDYYKEPVSKSVENERDERDGSEGQFADAEEKSSKTNTEVTEDQVSLIVSCEEVLDSSAEEEEIDEMLELEKYLSSTSMQSSAD